MGGGRGKIFLAEGNVLEVGGNFPGANVLGRYFPEGLYPRGHFSGHLLNRKQTFYLKLIKFFFIKHVLIKFD